MVGGDALPRVVNTPWGPVECAVWGEGPVVLALHGAMGGHDQGQLMARTIGSPGYQTVALSRPGYLGTPLGAALTAEAQADLCAATLDALGLGAAVVMAISAGGPSALHFALRHRARCLGLVLISTCAGPLDTPVPVGFQVAKFLSRWPAAVAAMRWKALGDIEKAARRSISDPTVRARTVQDEEVGPYFTALLASPFDHMALRMPGTEADIAITRDFRTPLEEVAVPTLVVHGTADVVVPFGPHGKVLAQRIPGADLLTVEGGEHVCVFTHADLIRPRVAAFLSAVTQ